jgi:hypothetical protein
MPFMSFDFLCFTDLVWVFKSLPSRHTDFQLNQPTRCSKFSSLLRVI